MKRVALQVPDLLKSRSRAVAKLIEEKTDAKVIIFGDSCYGACDLADLKAKKLGADLLIHFGHSPLGLKSVVPTLYIELKDDIEVLTTLRSFLDVFEGFERIGLAATVQHVHKLEEVKKFLERRGKLVVIGKGNSRIKYDGQILGCNVSACKSIENRVDCFLCVSGGNFHGLGIALNTGKPVFVLDPYQKEVRNLEKLRKDCLKKKYSRVEAASHAKRFGVVIGLKKGQFRLNKALEIKGKLSKAGKRPFLIAMNQITPNRLINFRKIDAFIITACPRIPYDLKGWNKPVINTEDFNKMLNLFF